MHRRALLSRAGGFLGACGVGVVAGCVDDTGDDASVSVREFPSRPSSSDPAAVVSYVAAYEEVYAHNVHAENDAVSVSVDAVATFDHTVDGTAYATAQHAGTVSYRDSDRNRSVGEVYSDRIPYALTTDRTKRMDVTREPVTQPLPGVTDTDESTEDSTDPPLGIRLLNVMETSADAELTITHQRDVSSSNDDRNRNEEATRSIDQAVSIDAESALVLGEIAAIPDSYRIVVRTDENGVTSEGRIAVDLSSADRNPTVDAVIAADGIATRHLPTFEPI